MEDLPTEWLVPTDRRRGGSPEEFRLHQIDSPPGLVHHFLTEQAADFIRRPGDLAGVLNRLERCRVLWLADAVHLLDADDL